MKKIIIKIIIYLTSLLSITNISYGFSNDFFVTAGIGTSHTVVDTYFKTSSLNLGGAIGTRFGYRFNNFELNLTSYINIGKIDAKNLPGKYASIYGEGMIATSMFSPTIKYILENPKIKKNWNFYLFVGPTWATQQLYIREFNLRTVDYEEIESFESEDKIIYNSKGITCGIGLEEILPHKKMHPFYIELVYSYLKAYRVNVVNTSDFLAIEMISSDRTTHKLSGHFYLINIGITIF